MRKRDRRREEQDKDTCSNEVVFARQTLQMSISLVTTEVAFDLTKHVVLLGGNLYSSCSSFISKEDDGDISHFCVILSQRYWRNTQ